MSGVIQFREPLHILGGGSIGLLWAASIRSVFPSYPVRLLLRDHHRCRINCNSSKISTKDSARGEIIVSLTHNTDGGRQRPRMVPVPAALISSYQVRSSQTQPFRNLLLTTKAFQAKDAILSLLEYIDEKTKIIIMCNGALAVREIVSDVLSTTSKGSLNVRPSIHLALTTHGAYRETMDEHDDFFHVVHAGRGRTLIENYPEMAHLWTLAGLSCESMSRDLERELWYKLAANCVINPLTALHGCTNGDILDTNTSLGTETLAYADMVKQILGEVSLVAKASNPECVEQYEVSQLERYVQGVISETSNNKSSMLQDVHAQRETEIDFLNGFIVQQGSHHGLECGVNQSLVGRIHSMTKTNSI